MKILQKLVQDPYTYIESAGKQDKATVAAALQNGGEGTVLRACLWRNS
jgi:hypothetical protein